MDLSEKTVSPDEKSVENFGDKAGTTNRKRTGHVGRARGRDYERSGSDAEDRQRRTRGDRSRRGSRDRSRSRSGDRGRCRSEDRSRNRSGDRSRSRSGDRSLSRSGERSRCRSGDKHKEEFQSSSDNMEGETRNTNLVKGEDHSIKLEENSKLDHAMMQTDDRHWSETYSHETAQRDRIILKWEHNIGCKGENIPHPLRSWDDLTVPRFIREVIDKRGYKKPTPIQMQSIPIALQRRDVLGAAGAGSGKTVAYLVPLFAWIHGLPKCEMMKNSTKAPDAVILTPTRLVAQHVKEECDKFGEASGIRTTTVIGGVNITEQTKKLSSGCEIVVATPGRLLDVLERGILVLNHRTSVVMDEFDVMIELDFEPVLRKILDIISEMPEIEGAEEDGAKCHQTVVFTSTMPHTVERFARTILHDPCVVQVI